MNKEITFSIEDRNECYAVEIIDNTAYCTFIDDLSDYHPSVKDSDFVGTKKECADFIDSKNIDDIYGMEI